MTNSLNNSDDFDNRIRLIGTNRDAIRALLRTVQSGRALNDFDDDAVLRAAIRAEESLMERGIPFADRTGATVEHSLAGAEHSAYKYPIDSTSLLLARDELGWYLQSVARVPKFPGNRVTWAVKLTTAQCAIVGGVEAFHKPAVKWSASEQRAAIKADRAAERVVCAQKKRAAKALERAVIREAAAKALVRRQKWEAKAKATLAAQKARALARRVKKEAKAVTRIDENAKAAKDRAVARKTARFMARPPRNGNAANISA
jgi:hypothetical protein